MEAIILIVILSIVLVFIIGSHILENLTINSMKKSDKILDEMGECINTLVNNIKEYRKDIEELSKPENYDKRQEILKIIEETPNYKDNEWMVAARADILAINKKEQDMRVPLSNEERCKESILDAIKLLNYDKLKFLNKIAVGLVNLSVEEIKSILTEEK